MSRYSLAGEKDPDGVTFDTFPGLLNINLSLRRSRILTCVSLKIQRISTAFRGGTFYDPKFESALKTLRIRYVGRRDVMERIVSQLA